jgi:hypothetical protein
MCLKVIRYGCEHCSCAVDLRMSLSSSGRATFKREWEDKDTCLEYRCVLNGVFEMSNISASESEARQASQAVALQQGARVP